MNSHSKANSKENSIFELKGSLFTFTVLHLLKPNLDALAEQLAVLVQQTPKFFYHMPLIIDLHKLSPATSTIDFNQLALALRQSEIIPVGIRGGSSQQQKTAIEAGLAILPNAKTELPESDSARTEKVSTPISAFSKIITQPIRSGQQIYAKQADLIILAPVSAGAELLADGNIHVYSTLRGRALAGISGNTECRIFCQHLDAELVSIAGHYWVSEDLHNTSIKQNAQIYLENDRLNIANF